MGNIPSTVADLIADINGKPAALSSLAFAPVAANCTITGYFIDAHGVQSGNRITPYVLSGSASMATVAGGTIPPNAVGFEGTISATIYYNRSVVSGTIGQSPAAGDPQFVATNTWQIGRVG